jgi:hypothetical protein
MLKIWGRKNSSNVRKPLWAAEELGLAYEAIDAGGAFGVVDTPEYRAMNPNGRVPVIEDDGFVLWESNAIVRYLMASRANGTAWYPTDLKARAAAPSSGLVRPFEAASGLSESGHDCVDLILTIDTLDCTCAAGTSNIAAVHCGCVVRRSPLFILFFPSWCVIRYEFRSVHPAANQNLRQRFPGPEWYRSGRRRR